MSNLKQKVFTGLAHGLVFTCGSVKPRKPVDHPGRGVSPDPNLAPVRGDGENVGGAPQRGDGHPARVGTEGNVLDKTEN